MEDENNMTNSKDLQKKLEDAKTALNVMNERIIRIVGRPRRITKDIISNRNDKYIERVADKNNYDKNLEGKNSQNRLHSGAILIYEESKPKLNSRIVRELPSRKDIVAVQCADSESHARNRRIFGSLLGTLQKFNLEESRLRQKEEKKALIERKVEKQALLENEFIKKEREELFINRKKKQAEIKQLEQKMNRLHDFEMWQNSFQQINRSIATKTLPQIYFRPKIYSKKTQRLLNETQERLNKELKNKRLLLESDFSALENFNNKESINNNQHHRDRNGNNDKDISRSYSNSKISSSVRLNSALSSTATSIRFRAEETNDSNCEKNYPASEPLLWSTVNIVKHSPENSIVN